MDLSNYVRVATPELPAATAADGGIGSPAAVSANAAPSFATSTLGVQAFSDLPITFSAGASDADGDPLTYTLGKAEHGTATIGANGTVAYTPAAGFTGFDSFTVTASDGKDGSATEVVKMTVSALDLTGDWRLFAGDKFAGEVGGTGTVFGTAAAQTITVLDRPGTIGFDPSFNQGGDAIRLVGNASRWAIEGAGSTAVVSDGDTYLAIPLSAVGTALVFDDGARTLKFDGTRILLGGQTVSGALAAVTAPTDDAVLPASEASASARLFLASGGTVAAGGHLTIFGTTTGNEDVTVTKGTVGLDPSFNHGGDTLSLSTVASIFDAMLTSGSTVTLTGPGLSAGSSLSVAIPVSTTDMTLDFPNLDKTLHYDQATQTVFIGSQSIGFETAHLSNLP